MDDLGNVSDEFQENYYEALKQKGIENYDKAIELLVECKNLDPNNASVYFELSKNYFEIDQYDLAEKALENAGRLKPNNQWILEGQYLLFYAQNKTEKVESTLLKLVALKAKYQNMLIKHYLKTRQYDEALKVLNTLEQTTGSNKEHNRLRHQTYIFGKKYKEYANYLTNKVKNKTATESDFTSLIIAYGKLKQNNKSFEATKLYQKTYPNSDYPYLSLYKFYLSKNNIPEAITALHRVSNSNSLNQQEKFKVANDFFQYTKKHPEYLPELEKVVKVFPHQTLLTQLASIYQESNNEKASELIATSGQSNSNSFQDLKLLTSILLKGNKYQDALKTSEKALELYPAQAILYLQQAKAFQAINQPKKALASLELGIDYIIDNPRLEGNFYLQMALAYKDLNDLKNEQKYLQKAKKANPKS